MYEYLWKNKSLLVCVGILFFDHNVYTQIWKWMKLSLDDCSTGIWASVWKVLKQPLQTSFGFYYNYCYYYCCCCCYSYSYSYSYSYYYYYYFFYYYYYYHYFYYYYYNYYYYFFCTIIMMIIISFVYDIVFMCFSLSFLLHCFYFYINSLQSPVGY